MATTRRCKQRLDDIWFRRSSTDRSSHGSLTHGSVVAGQHTTRNADDERHQKRSRPAVPTAGQNGAAVGIKEIAENAEDEEERTFWVSAPEGTTHEARAATTAVRATIDRQAPEWN